MPFRESVAVYCENHMEHRTAFCGQNAESEYVKAGDILYIEGPSGFRELIKQEEILPYFLNLQTILIELFYWLYSTSRRERREGTLK
jgi:hypothetical protein